MLLRIICTTLAGASVSDHHTNRADKNLKIRTKTTAMKFPQHLCYGICFVFCFFGCKDPEPMTQHTTAITIDIQPFSDVDNEQADYVLKEIKKIYPKVELKSSIPIPPQAYYKARNRYRADSLLNFLNRRSIPGHVTMALTTKDISWTKGTIKDYGIMGLGLCPGDACVASTYRLSKTNTPDQLYKIAIHELGHTQGLKHCPAKTCLMRDAEGKNHTDELSGFCRSCRQHLITKGWAL
jgi:archaemetzincin